MTKLLIRVITNLLVNKLIAELFDNGFGNSIPFFRFEDYDDVISRCLLMDIESVSKLVASSDERFISI